MNDPVADRRQPQPSQLLPLIFSPTEQVLDRPIVPQAGPFGPVRLADARPRVITRAEPGRRE
jgi:hypothetical protein